MAYRPFRLTAAAAALLFVSCAFQPAQAQDVVTFEPGDATLAMLGDQGAMGTAARSMQESAVEERLDATRKLLLEGLNRHSTSLTLKLEGPSGQSATALAAKDHIAKPAELETHRFGLWSSGALVVDTTPSQDGRAAALYTDGLTFGADALIDPQLLIGAALGLAFDDQMVDASSASLGSRYVSSMLYGTLSSGSETYFDFSAGAARMAFSTARCVAGGVEATGTRPGTQFFTTGQYSYRHKTGPFILKPFGRAALARTALDGFSENGPQSYAYDAQTVTHLSLSLGLSGETALRTTAGWIRPHAELKVADNAAWWTNGNISDPGVAGSYLVEGTDTFGRQLNLGLGVDWAAAGSAKFGLNYNVAAPLAGADALQSVKAIARLKF